MSRRRRRGVSGPYGMRRGVVVAIALLFGLLLFLRVEDNSPDRYVVLSLAEHPLGTVTPYVPKRAHFPAFYLVHTPEDQVYAVVRLAPRSNCFVVWDEEIQRFTDPCDAAHYDWAGTPVGHDGPALRHLAVERSEIDQVMIDLGTRRAGPGS